MTATATTKGSAAPTKGTKSSKSSGSGSGKMTDAHKAALAEGREHGKIVSNYLDALEAHKPKRGRKATPESLNERIAKTDAQIAGARGSERLALIQHKMDLQAQLRRIEHTTVITDLEQNFVKVAKTYAKRKGLTYAAFREAGVPANVLKEAGITRKAS